MLIASMDCGTTHSRVYVVDENGTVLGQGIRKVGVRDSAITGNSDLLRAGIKEAFEDALITAGLEGRDVSLSVAAGMITSELGLREVPHLNAPAGVRDLAGNLVRVDDENLLPFDIPAYLIPGVKNGLVNGAPRPEDVNLLDFMRGEETQVVGTLLKFPAEKGLTVVVLSSHTKFISIDREGLIRGSVTTLSGQLYEAIKNETFIGKSIEGDPDDASAEFWDEQVIANAAACVESAGFLRSLMMGRFFDVLMKTRWYERKLFVEASIAAEDMRALDHFGALGFDLDAPVILVGPEVRCRIYRSMMRSRLVGGSSVVHEPDEIDQLNIQGSLAILKEAGIVQ
jgi:2-dehydro-3-deoxygalactonokinase